MGSVNTPPEKQARSIFADLGYSVDGTGTEFSAVRDWKEVRVHAVTGDPDTPSGDAYRCFVTWTEDANALADALRTRNPDFEWAVIGVSDDGGYEVARAPPTH
jgi:hypothetical protein